MLALDKDAAVRAAILAGSLLVGIGGALQVGVNTKLGQHFGYGLFGTLMSFATGWLLLCAMVVVETISCSSNTAEKTAPSVKLFSSDTNSSTPQQAVEASSTAAAGLTPPPRAPPHPTHNAAGSSPDVQPASQAVPGPSQQPGAARQRVPLTWSPPSIPLVKPWLLLPGALGVTFVCLSIVISGTIGFALWWIPVIAAQLCSSAVLDHAGWAIPSPRRLTLGKAVGLLLAVLGAVLSVIERLLPASSSASGAPTQQAQVSPGTYAGCILGALLAGLLMPVQAGLNRQASGYLPSRLQATWWSFTMGTLTVLLAFAINQAAAAPALPPGLPAPSSVGDHLRAAFASSVPRGWWMYTGGVLGVAYIGTSILWTPLVGSAPYFVCLVCGQLIGSAWLDAAPILPATTWPPELLTGVPGPASGVGGTPGDTGPAIPITAMRGAGIGLVITAAVLVGFG